jgi:hypothetical protein
MKNSYMSFFSHSVKLGPDSTLKGSIFLVSQVMNWNHYPKGLNFFSVPSYELEPQHCQPRKSLSESIG